MGFSRHKPKQSTNLATRKGVRRDYVEEAQRNTRGVQQASDKNGIKSDRHPESGSRHDQMQAYMAAIRSEAVQARRLAEQIDNLSQNAPTQTRKQAVMTDSTTIDSDKMQEKQRRVTDKPRAAKVRSSFNPLHPSMELPPEQLIRLLGLESKKIRKHQRKQPASARQTTASPSASTTSLSPEPERLDPAPATSRKLTARSTHRQREYEQAREPGESKNRHSLWRPALAAGLICGAAASAYLFWMQPQHGASSTAVAPAPKMVNRSPATGSPGNPVTNKTATARKSTPVSATKNDPAWQATIEARGKHLRDEAKQRFEQRLKQTAHKPSIAAVPVTAPQSDVSETDPQAVQTPSIAIVPVIAPQPDMSKTDTQAAQTPSITTVPVSEPQPEVITTGTPTVELETVSHDETLVESAENSTPNLVSKPEDKALEAPETPSIENSNAGKLNEEPVHATTAEQTDQPSDENTTSIPTLDTPPQEGATELF